MTFFNFLHFALQKIGPLAKHPIFCLGHLSFANRAHLLPYVWQPFYPLDPSFYLFSFPSQSNFSAGVCFLLLKIFPYCGTLSVVVRFGALYWKSRVDGWVKIPETVTAARGPRSSVPKRISDHVGFDGSFWSNWYLKEKGEESLANLANEMWRTYWIWSYIFFFLGISSR